MDHGAAFVALLLFCVLFVILVEMVYWVYQRFYTPKPLTDRPTGKDLTEWMVIKRFAELNRQVAEAYEIGYLHCRMQFLCEISGPYLRRNKLAICALARLCKWKVEKCEVIDEDWVWFHMTDTDQSSIFDNEDGGTATFLPPTDTFEPPEDKFEPPTEWTGFDDG